MKFMVRILIMMILISGGFTRSEIASSDRSTIWSEVKKIFTLLMGKCLVDPTVNVVTSSSNSKWHNAALLVEDCLKRRGLRALDRALSRDIITITDNVVLVRRKNDSQFLLRYDRNEKSFKDSNSTWQNGITTKLLYFLNTRTIQIKLPSFKTLIQHNEARHRHKHGGLGPMLLFGLVAAGLIVIPMGFQFLAVLGGKALLLAKLALILTSIQGLKKIATSQLNYGLYSTGHGGAWPYYDRKWTYDTDPYSSSSYHSGSGGLGTPVLDQYVHTSALPSFYPHTVTPRDGT